MSRTILIVEDYEDTRTFMRLLIESYGYQAIEAEDGLEAVESFRHYFPDLVLMDMSMPIMDGLEATREIRKFEGTEKIPIIAVTAHGQQFYERAIAAGCNAVLDKPVDFNNLEPFLNKYLNQ